MKKLLYILSFILFSWVSASAQDDNNEQNDRIREKMKEFIQKRLRLTKTETDKFSPVFIRYFNEWRQALRNREGVPKLDLQQRIVELRIRYRNEFREIVGERRSNQVYENQEIFIEGLRNNQRAERIKTKDDRPNKRFKALNQ
jgi:hypothetical protein